MTLLPLGILASSGGAAGAFELIQSTVLASTANTITFSSIPATYKHLQLRIVSKTTDASATGYMLIRLNNDSGANYSYHYLYGYGSGVASSGSSGSSFGGLLFMNGNDVGSSAFSPNIIDIHDYADTNRYKTLRNLGGRANGSTGSSQVHLLSGNWRSTSAVNRIDFSFGDGTNLSVGTRFSLYGIKG